MSDCPACGSRVPFSTVMRPRLSSSFECPRCGAELKLWGPLAWGTEIALFLVAVAVYSMVKNGFLEALALLAISALVTFLQSRFGPLELVRPGQLER